MSNGSTSGRKTDSLLDSTVLCVSGRSMIEVTHMGQVFLDTDAL